jgi:hypothetical protein
MTNDIRDLFRSYDPKHQRILACLYSHTKPEERITFAEMKDLTDIMVEEGVLYHDGMSTPFTTLGKMMMRLCVTPEGVIVV